MGDAAEDMPREQWVWKLQTTGEQLSSFKKKKKKKDILELQKQEVVIGRNERSRFGNTWSQILTRDDQEDKSWAQKAPWNMLAELNPSALVITVWTYESVAHSISKSAQGWCLDYITFS